MDERVYEIGFAARITMDAHSLNNEGATGNVIEPRTVVLADGSKTDGISGEMLKHLHAASLFHLTREIPDALCDACQNFSPMKADGNPKKKGTKVVDALNEALKSCILCDAHGFLVQDPTFSRKSTIEFGWALALPGHYHRDIHVHTRVAPGEKERPKADAENKTSEQMIYNRPTRSGVYAFVSVFQPWRIGLNEVNYTYIINDQTRASRYKLVLDAYESMFTRMEGAMTTTRLPHIEKIEGAILTSSEPHPVPLISPLKDDYIEEISKITKDVKQFSSLSELLNKIEELKTITPYKFEAYK